MAAANEICHGIAETSRPPILLHIPRANSTSTGGMRCICNVGCLSIRIGRFGLVADGALFTVTILCAKGINNWRAVLISS